MLVAIPRVDGWARPRTNREREMVRVLSYLAMTGKPVGIDRLRSRALGADQDHPVAPKTIHNVAGTIRSSIGSELLPRADSHGRYVTSPLVTVDAMRFAGLVAAAKATPTGDVAMNRLGNALELIEDIPLVDVRSGFSWWDDDGHARQVETVAIDAASQMVPLALAAGDCDVAQWAVHQARLVAPYAETLFTLDIDVAGAAGNRWRAKLIYVTCCDMLRDIDPGVVPKAATERAYRRAIDAS
jgi:DNA-binding SARP family transcriptional activator